MLTVEAGIHDKDTKKTPWVFVAKLLLAHNKVMLNWPSDIPYPAKIAGPNSRGIYGFSLSQLEKFIRRMKAGPGFRPMIVPIPNDNVKKGKYGLNRMLPKNTDQQYSIGKRKSLRHHAAKSQRGIQL